jgi:hypothetical protein
MANDASSLMVLQSDRLLADFRSRGRCFPLLQSGEHAAIDTGHGIVILDMG